MCFIARNFLRENMKEQSWEGVLISVPSERACGLRESRTRTARSCAEEELRGEPIQRYGFTSVPGSVAKPFRCTEQDRSPGGEIDASSVLHRLREYE